MKTCNKCKSIHKNSTMFCSNCGETLSATEETQQPVINEEAQQQQYEPSPIQQQQQFRKETSNPIVKKQLLSALNRGINSKYADLSEDELLKIIQAQSLRKLSSISAIVGFYFLLSAIAFVVGFITLVSS